MVSGVAAVAVVGGFVGATGTSVAVIKTGEEVLAVQQRLPQLGI